MEFLGKDIGEPPTDCASAVWCRSLVQTTERLHGYFNKRITPQLIPSDLDPESDTPSADTAETLEKSRAQVVDGILAMRSSPCGSCVALKAEQILRDGDV